MGVGGNAGNVVDGTNTVQTLDRRRRFYIAGRMLSHWGVGMLLAALIPNGPSWLDMDLWAALLLILIASIIGVLTKAPWQREQEGQAHYRKRR